MEPNIFDYLNILREHGADLGDGVGAGGGRHGPGLGGGVGGVFAVLVTPAVRLFGNIINWSW